MDELKEVNLSDLSEFPTDASGVILTKITPELIMSEAADSVKQLNSLLKAANIELNKLTNYVKMRGRQRKPKPAKPPKEFHAEILPNTTLKFN
jgi:hypothetical protein